MNELGIITSVADYVKKVQNLYQNKGGRKHLFFRGHSDISYVLKPSVFRNEKYNEKEILLDFKQYSPEFNLSYNFLRDIDKVLCDMQHNELPTRLLDWTVSPLTALYFAAQGSPNKDGRVWIFDPWKYNSKIINYQQHSQIHDIHIIARSMLALEKNDNEIEEFVKEEYHFQNKLNLDHPMAFVAQFTNKRKVFQRGTFLIFGKNKQPFDNLEQAKPYLNFYTVSQAQKKLIIQELNNLYINSYTIYPDFEGMRDMINEYGSLFNREAL